MLAAHGEVRRRPAVRAAPSSPGGSREAVQPLLHVARLGRRRAVDRRGAHDVGRRQRVDDAGRLRAARASAPTTRCSPTCCGGSCARRVATSTSTRRRRDPARRRAAGAQRLTRFALRRFWAPGRFRPDAGTTRSSTSSATSSAATTGGRWPQRIDRRIDRLPGLAGLGLVTGARQTVRDPSRGSARRLIVGAATFDGGRWANRDRHRAARRSRRDRHHRPAGRPQRRRRPDGAAAGRRVPPLRRRRRARRRRAHRRRRHVLRRRRSQGVADGARQPRRATSTATGRWGRRACCSSSR